MDLSWVRDGNIGKPQDYIEMETWRRPNSFWWASILGLQVKQSRQKSRLWATHLKKNRQVNVDKCTENCCTSVVDS